MAVVMMDGFGSRDEEEKEEKEEEGSSPLERVGLLGLVRST